MYTNKDGGSEPLLTSTTDTERTGMLFQYTRRKAEQLHSSSGEDYLDEAIQLLRDGTYPAVTNLA